MVLINCMQTYLVGNTFDSEALSVLCSNVLLVKRHYNKGSESHKTESDFILYYLAGLIEGDGHFNTPKKLTTPSGTARVAGIEVVFNMKDRPSAELLQSLFGGRLYDHSNKKVTR
jgi:hypothetical protein